MNDDTTLDGTDLVDELDYCLDEVFEPEETEAFLRFVQGMRDLKNELWSDRYSKRRTLLAEVGEHLTDRLSDLVAAIQNFLNDEVVVCEDCDSVVWLDEATSVEDKIVCDAYCLDAYSFCDNCESWNADGLNTVSGSEICDSCMRDCSYCDTCQEYYSDGDDDHDHDCECEAPHVEFEFPTPTGSVKRNERFEAALPKGTIDDKGIDRIYLLVRFDEAVMASDNAGRRRIRSIITDEVGCTWQTKRGNFTRRLSSALYKIGIKLDPTTISEVGNIARQHSANVSSLDIEFTRDMNESAEHFWHEGSCWWGSYASSRCAFKSWGGIAMRSLDTSRTWNDCSGRAWVQPLDANLEATHNAMNAHAFIVYNGYGELSGYTAARIVAHLTGRSYKKVDFDASPQYINAGGYLVADEETCAKTERVEISGYDIHDHLDAYSFARSAA